MHPGTEVVQRSAEQVLAFVIEFKDEHDGLSPTYREIMDACDISSTSMVQRYLLRLERQGKIECMLDQNQRIRGVMISGATWTPPD